MRLHVAILAALAAAPAAADPLEDLCNAAGDRPPAQCACIAEGLAADFDADETALYTAVTGRYLDGMRSGAAMADAWDAAVRAEAEERQVGFSTLLGRTNDLGQRHHAVIKACGG